MSQRKKLFLLVFVWTCLCLIIFKSVFLTSSSDLTLDVRYAAETADLPQAESVVATSGKSGNKLRARSAPSSSLRPHDLSAATVASGGEQPPPLATGSSASSQRQLNSPLLDLTIDSIPISEQARDNNQLESSSNSNSKLNNSKNPFFYDVLAAAAAAEAASRAEASSSSSSHSQFNVIDSKQLAAAISDQQQQASGNNQVISSTSTSSSSSSSPPSLPIAAPGDTLNGAANSANQFAFPNVNTNTNTNNQNHHHQADKPFNSNQISDNSNGKSSASQQQKHNNEQQQQQAIAGSQCHYDYPLVFDLQFNNIYWQKMTTRANSSSSSNERQQVNSSRPGAASGGSRVADASKRAPPFASYYLYNAYYDDRWRAGLPLVRILAMIDRVHPPPTNCLLWFNNLATSGGGGGGSASPGQNQGRPVPVLTRASFVYAWYPKWGNYEDGLLQPWIVTCPVPRPHHRLVPDSVSLVGVPQELKPDFDDESATTEQASPGAVGGRAKRSSGNNGDTNNGERVASSSSSSVPSASMAMPASFSSSSSSSSSSPTPAEGDDDDNATGAGETTRPMKTAPRYDCKSLGPISNNLPVYNRRPPPGKAPEKFAVCVKGLDFPYEDISIRLVEWIELLHLLGAKKIFLYDLDVHENIKKVLDYYEKRGIVELNKLTLPGEQPNLPEYQHLYLKQKLTSKRQNELIPYNDCLYRNLHLYKYLALLDIDEIIMPLKEDQNNWYDLMDEVEQLSLSEQNYSRASYNVRNVYFFDDLSGPLGTTQSILNTGGSGSNNVKDTNSDSFLAPSSGEREPTYDRGDGDEDVDMNLNNNNNNNNNNDAGGRRRDSLERGIPHYLHMMSHVYRSKNYTEPGQYVKCFHNTERVVSLHNHFPMNCFGQCTTYSIPVDLAHLQHYRKDCVGPLRQSCKNDFRHFTTRDTTIWKYKQRMIRRTTRVLNHLGLLSSAAASGGSGTTTTTTI